MRIIGGNNKKMRITPPPNLPVRPTTDFAREGLFSILQNSWDFDGMCILDLFAGTGSVSFEFASRGVAHITMIDQANACVRFIRNTIPRFPNTEIHVYERNVFTYLDDCRRTFDIIFADPPYELSQISTIPDLIFEKKLLAAGGWLILEHSAKYSFRDHPHFFNHRNYGSVNFSFFELPEDNKNE
ncbi:MAG: RsmD family RNA methyltransferase [Bacteroidota bacterium]